MGTFVGTALEGGRYLTEVKVIFETASDRAMPPLPLMFQKAMETFGRLGCQAEIEFYIAKLTEDKLSWEYTRLGKELEDMAMIL